MSPAEAASERFGDLCTVDLVPSAKTIFRPTHSGVAVRQLLYGSPTDVQPDSGGASEVSPNPDTTRRGS